MKNLVRINQVFFLGWLVILILTTVLLVQWQKESAREKIVFLNVGQGDAILIQKGDQQILVDGGRGRSVMSELPKYMPLLDRKIELFILTHPDEDHMGGLVALEKDYRVERVLHSGVACGKEICVRWEEFNRLYGTQTQLAHLGQEITLGEKIRLRILYPLKSLQEAKLKDENSGSVVVRAEVNGKTFLLTGDADSKVEKDLLGSGLDLRAEVLKVAHHGSGKSTSKEFLQAVGARQAVISVGENKYGHPDEKLLQRLQAQGVEILRTDERGSVVFE